MNHANGTIVIVGAGLAGLSAACRATELGLTPTVLEQGAAQDYLCNSRVTGGVVHFASESMLEPPEELASKVQKITAGFTNRAVTLTLAKDAKRAIEWLSTQGVRFVQISPLARHRWVFAPLRLARPALEPEGWKKRSGDAVLNLLYRKVIERGGKIVLGAQAESLVVEEGRCIGVMATRGDTTERHVGEAVLLADGGFQGNSDLVRRFISPRPEKIKQRGAGTGKGAALLMAEAVGADLVGTRYFYGHLLHREAMQSDALWPYPGLDSLATAGIVVNGRGVRFADEGLGGVFLANALAWAEDPLDFWVIFDEDIWNGPGKVDLFLTAANPMLVSKKATICKASSLQELETLVAFPQGALASTVDTYNDALARDALDTLHPARSTLYNAPSPIRKPPFYAVPLCSGLTFTMGGIRVDEHMRAIDTTGRPIPGLYAIGKSAGGMEGGEPVGYVGGLSLGLITALRAAEFIASTRAASAS